MPWVVAAPCKSAEDLVEVATSGEANRFRRGAFLNKLVRSDQFAQMVKIIGLGAAEAQVQLSLRSKSTYR
jgi:hypothetical protein